MTEKLRLAAMEPVGSPAIMARGLTKRFGHLTAVQDLSFEVRPGRVTGFLGPNGAGKSTTLRMILGLVSPTSGEATVLGLPYRSLERPAWVVGAVLESQSFHPLRSGRDHLRVLAAASAIPRARVDQTLDWVGLAAAGDRKAGSYSLGMRQRLGLAGALLGDPRVLVLDEPANGLDPQGIRWLRDFLREFAHRGNAVLVSSHLLGEMEQLADDILVIHRGRLVGHGSVDDLTRGTATVRVASPEAGRLAAALECAGMAVAHGDHGSLLVRNGSSERIGAMASAAGIALTELSTDQTTLEDVFIELTTEEDRR